MTNLETMIRNQAEINELELERLTRAIARCPKGNLAAFRNGKYYRYAILMKGQKAKHVSTKDKRMLQIMARKKMLDARRMDCEADLAICKQILPAFDTHPHAKENLLEDKGIVRLLTPSHPNADAEKWTEQIASHNPNHPEHLIVPTEAGIPVRSKDEAMILSGIMDLNLIFAYEPELEIENMIWYPDFKVMHPKTRKIFYIEHFGMMDNEDYQEQTYRKLKIYARNGIRQDENLICFFEYEGCPLSIVRVKHSLEDVILR